MAQDIGPVDVVAGESPCDWLLRHEAGVVSLQAALAFFDPLPCVELADMTGSWRGSALPTGHPMDGLLQLLGWWGKAFTDAEHVDPLLFETGFGQVHAVTSRFLPARILVNLRATSLAITVLRPFWPAVRALLRTRKPMARLRMIEHRGRVSATMCYDYLPIHDVFRRVDGTTVLGLMDMRGMPKPFFFILRRHKFSADGCLGEARHVCHSPGSERQRNAVLYRALRSSVKAAGESPAKTWYRDFLAVARRLAGRIGLRRFRAFRATPFLALRDQRRERETTKAATNSILLGRGR